VRDGGAYGCAVPRAYANLNPGLVRVAKDAWYDQRRIYRELCHDLKLATYNHESDCKLTTSSLAAISHLPDKSSAADPLPVSVMKMIAAELAPFLTELFNRSILATFRRHSKKPSLRRLSRSLGLMPWTLSRIAQILILLWCRSFLSGLWQGNSKATCSHLISYRLFSPVFDQATQQKLPSSVSCLIYTGGSKQ